MRMLTGLGALPLVGLRRKVGVGAARMPEDHVPQLLQLPIAL